MFSKSRLVSRMMAAAAAMRMMMMKRQRKSGAPPPVPTKWIDAIMNALIRRVRYWKGDARGEEWPSFFKFIVFFSFLWFNSRPLKWWTAWRESHPLLLLLLLLTSSSDQPQTSTFGCYPGGYSFISNPLTPADLEPRTDTWPSIWPSVVWSVLFFN